MTTDDYTKAVLYILRLRSWSCPRCGNPAVKASVESYQVHEYKNQVAAKVVCHEHRHTIGTRSINLREVQFVHQAEPWKKRQGPRLPGGPTR